MHFGRGLVFIGERKQKGNTGVRKVQADNSDGERQRRGRANQNRAYVLEETK